MYLVESFLTLQGEGAFVGTPSYFFRFGLCNLNCKGFGVKYDDKVGCDSFYAVDPIFKNTWNKINSLDDLTKYLTTLEYKPNVVLTGGEPLLNLEDVIFVEFLEYLYRNEYKVTIESNATLLPNFKNMPYLKKFTFSLSPKLSNSKIDKFTRINKTIINTILIEAETSYLKFVYSKNVEYELEELINWFKKFKIFVMPLGEDNKALQSSAKDAFNFVIKNNLLYSDRIHIRIFGDQRGV